MRKPSVNHKLHMITYWKLTNIVLTCLHMKMLQKD